MLWSAFGCGLNNSIELLNLCIDLFKHVLEQWFKQSGAKPWTGQAQATFSSSGQPVPAKFTTPNYNPHMTRSRCHVRKYLGA